MDTIAILWSIGALALILAINAKGAFRVALSWILTLAILGFALLFTSFKGLDFAQVVAGDKPAPREMQRVRRAPVPDSVAAQVALQSAPLLEGAKLTAQAIADFPEGDFGALAPKEREGWESHALALRNQSADLARQAQALRLKEAATTFESLRLAGYDVHAQFGADTITAPAFQRQAKELAEQILAELSAESKTELKN
jgi:hypothetical protein